MMHNNRQKPAVLVVSNLSQRNTVHVKFYLANVAKILAGLRLLDDREWATEGKPNLPANGKQVLTNAQMIDVGQIWPHLAKAGFELYDAYSESWKTEGLVVTLVFCKPEAMEEAGAYRLPEDAIMAVNELTGKVYQYAHAYENPDDSFSIIAIGPRGGEAVMKLEIKEGILNLLDRRSHELLAPGQSL